MNLDDNNQQKITNLKPGFTGHGIGSEIRIRSIRLKSKAVSHSTRLTNTLSSRIIAV